MIHIDKFNGRNCLIGFDDWDRPNYEMFVEAYYATTMIPNIKYFLGYGRCFCIISDDCKSASVHRYRENWNGYDDCLQVDLMTGERITRDMVYPNYAKGIHRTSFAS